MSIAKHHAEWLSLIEASGPFLSLPVLVQRFPQGMDAHDPDHAKALRQVYEEWDRDQYGDRGAGSMERGAIRWSHRETERFRSTIMPAVVELDEALARLKEIIARLGPDEEVVITDHNQPVARLVGGRKVGRQPRQAGNCKGMITLLVEDEEHLKDFEEYMPSRPV